MKKLICALFAMCLAVGLSACGCDDGADIDLVFVNDSSISISYVSTESAGHSGGVQNADSSPLERGESFGFEVGEYPAALVVHGGEAGREGLARLTLDKAPADGERWYVVARDGKSGLILSADIRWPEEM